MSATRTEMMQMPPYISRSSGGGTMMTAASFSLAEMTSRFAPKDITVFKDTLSINSLRNVFSIVGSGEKRPFNFPETPALAKKRLEENTRFFLANYIALILLIFFLVLFSSPLRLFLAAVVVAGWYTVLTQSKKILSHRRVVLGHQVGERDLVVGMVAVSIFFILFFMLDVIFFALLGGGLVSVGHAATRDNAELKERGAFDAKVNDEMMGKV